MRISRGGEPLRAAERPGEHRRASDPRRSEEVHGNSKGDFGALEEDSEEPADRKLIGSRGELRRLRGRL
eukprot:1857209-Alexandrium_andersonii.AAC.1